MTDGINSALDYAVLCGSVSDQANLLIGLTYRPLVCVSPPHTNSQKNSGDVVKKA